jgi:hypothetical protein
VDHLAPGLTRFYGLSTVYHAAVTDGIVTVAMATTVEFLDFNIELCLNSNIHKSFMDNSRIVRHLRCANLFLLSYSES